MAQTNLIGSLSVKGDIQIIYTDVWFLYICITTTALSIEATLRKLKPVLADRFFVERIGYFGSFATGEQSEDSDVDILVEFSRPIGWAFFDLNDLLERELDRKVDLVSKKALKPQIRDSILNQVKYV